MKYLILLLVLPFLPACAEEPAGVLKAPVFYAPYHWTPDSFPITVDLHPDLSSDTKTSVFLAAKRWNDAADFQVFDVHVASRQLPMFVSNGGVVVRGHVSVEYGDPQLPHAIAVAATYLRKRFFSIPGRIEGVRITFKQDYEEEVLIERQLTNVFVHELGHALGLEHDPWEVSSIMYPNAILFWQSISAQDVAYVRSQRQ